MPARDSRPLTPAELQALRRHKEQAVEQQVRTQLEQAQRMAAAGKPAAARRILETARRQAPGALQREIDRRLADLANR
jgi:type III secretion system FlhB-like substrate exporter